MKKTFKKIAATLSAAVMCAIPMASALSANATASSNARYTMRKVYWVDSTAYVKKINVGFTNKRAGCSPATITPLVKGTPSFGGSAGDVYYNCGGTLTANNYFGGPAISFSVICDSVSDYGQGSNVYCNAFKANGTQSYNSVRTVNAFLVGDVNDDGIINDKDHVIVDAAGRAGANTYSATDRIYVNLNGTTKSYLAYKLDINDDGRITLDDAYMLNSYVSNQLQKFPR